MSPLTELQYNQTDYDLSTIDPLSMLEDFTRTSNSPTQAELDTSSGTDFSPEFSPQHSQHSSGKDQTRSDDQSSRSSTANLSPGTTISKSKSKSTKTSPKTHQSEDRVQKRTLNTLAARRYRQKRLDQMSELEAVLKETQAERDALRVRVARLEGEVDVLRGLVRS